MVKKIIKDVIENFVKKECINEINYIAKKSPITICSLNDFITICQGLGVNDGNVEELYGNYCFIEIGSTKDRCVYDAYYTNGYDEWDNDGEKYYNEGQFYFKDEHVNVLKLEFDDNINISKENELTNVKLSPKEIRQNNDYKKMPKLDRGTFRYPNAKGFSIVMADQTNDFIENNLNQNPNVKFVIHCRMGQSRSGAMGYYLAKKLKLNIEEYLSEYEVDKTFINKNNDEKVYKGSQFRLGVNRKGGGDTMNNRVSALMNASDENRRGNSKEYNKFKQQGEYGDFSLTQHNDAENFHQDLRKYIGDKNNPKIFRSVKGYNEK